MAFIVTEFEYELVRAVQRFSVEGLLSPGFGFDALFLLVDRFLFSFIQSGPSLSTGYCKQCAQLNVIRPREIVIGGLEVVINAWIFYKIAQISRLYLFLFLTLGKVPSKEQVDSLSQELRSRATVPGTLACLLYFSCSSLY